MAYRDDEDAGQRVTSQQPLSDSGQTSSIETPVAPSLTSVMGVAPVLPGEPADFYQRSLNALIKELGARSVWTVKAQDTVHTGGRYSYRTVEFP